jgi:tetratricopeptide (TPR) repeat protein
MSIEKLKEQARRHEQKEEWQKALDEYKVAIKKLAEDDQPDIGLYNRVGDLYVRVGNLDQAVKHYEESVDLYMETFLPNNAIAVCKKIIRNVPDRHDAYLKMGQIRAEQGFLPDARANFLTYAERMQQAGDLDESFRALVEFCDLAPDELDIRLMVADQMASHDRVDDAVEQLLGAYRHLIAKGDSDEASMVEAKIRELDPSADLSAAPETASAEADEPALVDTDDLMGHFSDIATGDSDDTGGSEAQETDAGAADIDLVGFDIDTGGDTDAEQGSESAAIDIGGDDESEPSGESPAFAIGDDADDAEGAELPSFDAGGELPTFGTGDDAGDDAGAELPTFDSGDAAADAGAELPTFDSGDDVPAADPPEDAASEADESVQEAMEDAAADGADGDEALTMDDVRARIAADPSDVALRQRLVELAYGTGEDSVLAAAFLGLAQTLDGAGENARAQAAYQQVIEADPTNEVAAAALGAGKSAQPVSEVAASEDYVDLGALLLGDDEGEKSTRFTVAYEEPTGDEEADFAKMLSQFKEKVSENLDADDVRAHHDLGTAYKEMGLLDEAVSEFQAALRASPNHLPTYELLGVTFMEMGQPEATVNSLERALDVEYEIEDELLGIYYYLARASEELGKKERAVELYEKVFSLDINFADVTDRLRDLR